MDRLPDEIILRIIYFIATSEWQLLELEKVSKKIQCIIQDQTLWYQLFQQHYKTWGRHVSYTSRRNIMDWKSFVIHLAKQKQRNRSFTFDFVSDNHCIEPPINRKRKLHELARSTSSPSPPSYKNLSRHQDTPLDNSTFSSSSSIPTSEPSFDRQSLRYMLNRNTPMPFRIQDPLVVDINRMTRTGIVATGKHRKSTLRSNHYTRRSEHKILFWEYPSWRLVRELEITFMPPDITCQVVGVQSILIKSPDNTTPQRVRFFALAIGKPAELHGHMHMNDLDDPDGNDDRVDLWQAILIYRLFDNGVTQCLAHLPLDGRFMGREVFFFSDYSWTFGDDMTFTDPRRKMKDWLQIVAPEHTDFDPHYTLFMLAIGPTYPEADGCGKLIQFDLRGHANVLDPSLTPMTMNPTLQRIIPTRYGSVPRQQSLDETMADFSSPPPSAKIIHTVYLGSHVSCMIHFRYPTHLNHLICKGSYESNELSIYDWRFGIKVGTLPWKEEEFELQFEVRPWGLESTMVLPSYWDQQATSNEDLAHRGFRLIAVGDNRMNRLEIKVWDISFLLRQEWDPLCHDHVLEDWTSTTNIEDWYKRIEWTKFFPWWRRGNGQLWHLGLRMVHERVQSEEGRYISSVIPFELRRLMKQEPGLQRLASTIQWPFSPPKPSMLLAHAFDKPANGMDDVMTVKYTAYNVLYTSLFLLTEDGKVTVMDIETGQVTGTIDNVAAMAMTNGQMDRTRSGRIRGIDVNVVAGREIVVTSREGLLRSVMS
ncbi:uncharacterized protein BX664DRAFT_272683 [Halteromyces radiatus]|uniref:uncharacterized protein n=1 Tax=Halteromyces radiatus TaxID=101107 RepID=UPI00221F28C2|nr:uncharacterized protein BX664DRAFT_272683 [Halteromyces radiatus]KAI8099443.1 hypothetical protein BX664DRAFT_272683 [Halteromyces radiatus]